jgi:endonuclease-3 related protein
MVGAILTQNTNWANVEKAINNLKAHGLLEPRALYKLDKDRLAMLIRPAGYYNIKAGRLRALLEWLFTRYKGDLDALANVPTESLRQQLLSISGIGPETADSILLYALDRPKFVVDAYTARIMARHGLIEPPFDYDQLQDLFHRHLPADLGLYNEYHALLVRLGKQYCRPSPRCQGCPLEDIPHVIEPQGSVDQ